MSLPLLLIAAVADNGVIGRDNRLLWRLKTDLRRFRGLTLGHPLIMGRKTFESIGAPLPGRESIVLTRDCRWAHAADAVHRAHNLDDALAMANKRADAMGARRVIVAGGAEIYAQTIGRADALAITHVALSPPGDAVFPAIDPVIWQRESEEAVAAGPDDEAASLFVTYRRR